MTRERVKYFDKGDMSIGFYLDRLKLVVDSDLTTANGDINTILELVNIIKFIENGIYDKRWSKEFRKKVNNTKPKYHKIISTYFSSLTAQMLPSVIAKLDNEYVNDFLDQFEKFDLGTKVKENEFRSLIDISSIPFWEIVRSKYLTTKYPNVMKEEFLSKPQHFETFLDNFTSSRGNKVFVPNTVSKVEMLKFCNDYIDSDDANINYLQILTQPIKGLEVHMAMDASTRLKAKQRAQNLENELFKDRMTGGKKVKMAVLSSKSTYEKELAASEPTDFIALVDGQWIDDHHDYPTLLNNVQYLYDIFSSDLISELPSFPRLEMGVFETHMGVSTNNSYVVGQFFSIKQRMATMKLQALSDLLDRHKIRLEEVIDWFFSTYSEDVFGIKWLPLNMPLKNESKANQTATLLRIEEYIRTQYHILATKGSIDSELVEMTNTPSFRELSSLVENKYIYLTESDDMQIIVNLLYSDQSSITYISDDLKGQHFVELIVKNDVKLSELHEYQTPSVRHLIDKKIVIESENGMLRLRDPLEAKLLRDLYTIGVIGYKHVSQKEQAKLESMLKKEMVAIGDTLYTKQEQDYLNFMLNNSVFDNSWAIRNSYQHGLPSYDTPDHYAFDNLIVILILLMHVIKINDELSLQRVAAGGETIYCDIVLD